MDTRLVPTLSPDEVTDSLPLAAQPLDLSDASSALVETCSALALSLREGDVEAADRLFSFVTDQLADRRTAVTEVLAAMLLRSDCRVSLQPLTPTTIATSSGFLAGLRHPVSPAGRRSVLLYAASGGSTALALQMTAVLLDEAHVPVQLQYGLDVELLAHAASDPSVAAVALGVSGAGQALQSQEMIRRLRRDGLPVVVVADPAALNPELVRSVGASAAGWEPGELSDLLQRVRGPLSPGEAEVLRFAADGYTNNRIAHELDISVSAVKARLEASYAKLQAADRAHAVAIAIRQRWIL